MSKVGVKRKLIETYCKAEEALRELYVLGVLSCCDADKISLSEGVREDTETLYDRAVGLLSEIEVIEDEERMKAILRCAVNEFRTK